MIMDSRYLHCNMNSLDLSITRRWLPISALMWRFVPAENVFLQMRGGDGGVLVHLEKCLSWFLRTPFFYDKSAATLLHQHLGEMGRHPPSGSSIWRLLGSVPSEALSGEGCYVLCLKWKEVSWGVTKCTGTMFDCLALVWGAVLVSVWCLSLAAGLPHHK